MVFLSVLLGVGVDYFIDYLFLPARRNKPMIGQLLAYNAEI